MLRVDVRVDSGVDSEVDTAAKAVQTRGRPGRVHGVSVSPGMICGVIVHNPEAGER